MAKLRYVLRLGTQGQTSYLVELTDDELYVRGPWAEKRVRRDSLRKIGISAGPDVAPGGLLGELADAMQGGESAIRFPGGKVVVPGDVCWILAAYDDGKRQREVMFGFEGADPKAVAIVEALLAQPGLTFYGVEHTSALRSAMGLGSHAAWIVPVVILVVVIVLALALAR